MGHWPEPQSMKDSMRKKRTLWWWLGGGIDPHLDREPSEKGKKQSDPSRCSMRKKTSPGSVHRQTTLPFRRGRPFRVKPAQSFQNPLSQQTFELESLESAKKGGGWNANVSGGAFFPVLSDFFPDSNLSNMQVTMPEISPKGGSLQRGEWLCLITE